MKTWEKVFWSTLTLLNLSGFVAFGSMVNFCMTLALPWAAYWDWRLARSIAAMRRLRAEMERWA